MIKIINIGMNHNTAGVELRECIAAEPDNIIKVLSFMRESECIKEGHFISTCNRVEAIFTTDNVQEAKRSVCSFISRLVNIPEENFLSSTYTFEDMDAVKHIFRVASSLDSMVVGEPQILGQIKASFAVSIEQKSSGVILNRLMHKAFHAAKRVRTETGICEAAVSISYAAVELAKKIFHVLDNKKVLVIGAGEMAELAAKHLKANGVKSIVVANRTFERAEQLAKIIDACPVSFEEISSELQEVDIVIASTASQEHVITRKQVKKCLRKRRNRPLFFIDIAVPRDVQPEVNRLENVYVYDIDDLKGAVKSNMAQRQKEAIKAERIVQEEVVKYERWLKTLKVVPTIVSLIDKTESIIKAEIKKSSPILEKLTPEQKKAVDKLSRSIAQKMINDPILYLKRKADRPALNTYIDVTRKLFNLDEDRNQDQDLYHGYK